MPHVYWMREGPTVHVTWREPATNDSDVAFHEPQGHARLSADVFLDGVVEFLRWCGEAVEGRDSDLATEIGQAAETYAAEVRSRAFPSADQTYRPK